MENKIYFIRKQELSLNIDKFYVRNPTQKYYMYNSSVFKTLRLCFIYNYAINK